jgi:hypothetical protein
VRTHALQQNSVVGRSARGIWDNDAHRPAWIGLRAHDAREGRQRGRTRGQMQKSSGGLNRLWTKGGIQYAPPIR